jgi:hypothetical protein
MASQSNPDQSGPTRRPAVLQEMPSRANVNVSKVSEPLQMMKVGSIKNANFPMDAEGRVYHIGVKFGEGWRRFFLFSFALFPCLIPIFQSYYFFCALFEFERVSVAPRIVTVGDPRRAERLAQYLDNPNKMFRRASNRGFVVYTGRYKNVRLLLLVAESTSDLTGRFRCPLFLLAWYVLFNSTCVLLSDEREREERTHSLCFENYAEVIQTSVCLSVD